MDSQKCEAFVSSILFCMLIGLRGNGCTTPWRQDDKIPNASLLALEHLLDRLCRILVRIKTRAHNLAKTPTDLGLSKGICRCLRKRRAEFLKRYLPRELDPK